MFEFENHRPEEVFLSQEGRQPLPHGALHSTFSRIALNDVSQYAGA